MMNRLVTAAAPPLATVTKPGDCGGTQGQRKTDKAAKATPAEEVSRVLNSNEENDLTLWGWYKSGYEPVSLYVGGLHGIASDPGPTAVLRRQYILDRYGLKVPTTGKERKETGGCGLVRVRMASKADESE